MALMTRRNFTRTAGVAAAVSYSRILGANDRVRVGYIGLGNRGDQVQDAFLEYGDQETVAICDLRNDYLDWAEAKEKKRGLSPKRFLDYRKLLEVKDMDAVVIATPDHWHAIQFIAACRAGFDVYVEKPLSQTIKEGRRMVVVARETKRVTQVGIQRRSTPFLQEGAELVREGGIGHVVIGRGYHYRNEAPHGIGNPPNLPPPSRREWDQWLGPAPAQPYNRNKSYYNFRWFYDFSGGQLTNFGVHYLDLMRWHVGLEWPVSVTAIGGKYVVEDNREIPDTLEVLWEYAGGHILNFSQCDGNKAPGNARNSEVMLRGTKGTMYIDMGYWEVVPEEVNDRPRFPRTPIDRAAERANRGETAPVIKAQRREGKVTNEHHVRNFLDCVKSRAKCNCDILDGHISTSTTILGKIALLTKSHLQWDAVNERFTNNEEANKMLHYEYREGYTLG